MSKALEERDAVRRALKRPEQLTQRQMGRAKRLTAAELVNPAVCRRLAAGIDPEWVRAKVKEKRRPADVQKRR